MQVSLDCRLTRRMEVLVRVVTSRTRENKNLYSEGFLFFSKNIGRVQCLVFRLEFEFNFSWLCCECHSLVYNPLIVRMECKFVDVFSIPALLDIRVLPVV